MNFKTYEAPGIYQTAFDAKEAAAKYFLDNYHKVDECLVDDDDDEQRIASKINSLFKGDTQKGFYNEILPPFYS